MSIVNVNSQVRAVNVVQVATDRPLGGHPSFQHIHPHSAALGQRLNAVVQQYPRWSRRYGRWALLATIAALADGKLLLAGAAGFGLYQWVSAQPDVSLAPLRTLWQQCRDSCNGPLVKPLALGSSAFGLTYLTALLWQDFGTVPTLVTLGFGTVNGFTLWLLWRGREGLLRPIFDHAPVAPGFRPATPPHRNPVAATEMPEAIALPWPDLSSPNPLKRLLAVRALTHACLIPGQGEAVYLPGSQISLRSHLLDCYHLMLTQEPEPAVRAALRDAIGLLKPKAQLGPGQPALSHLERRAAPVAIPHRRVEYLEP